MFNGQYDSMSGRKINSLAKKQREFIVQKYKDHPSCDAVAEEFCRSYGRTNYEIKKLSDHSVMLVLEEEGVEVLRKEKNGVPVLSKKYLTDEIREFVIRKYTNLGKGLSGFMQINKLLMSEKGFCMEYNIFETVLKQGGIDVNSAEYRYGENGRP
jgi:hypothetical protein